MNQQLAIPVSAQLQRDLVALLGADGYRVDRADCWSYGYDNSKRHALPAVVALPTEAAQIIELVRLCRAHRLALTCRGRGTATTGAAVPTEGGLVLSLERMQRLLEYHPDDRYVVVEPGITNQALQDAVAPDGFFWPPDPTSSPYCTVGGNLACNAAGPRAVKYGTPRDNTLGLRVVTGTGASLRTGVFTTKGVVGYDLTRLLIGSEGTLAIITAAILKLTPLPQAKTTLRAAYSDVEAAARAIARIMAQPIIPCALEFIDGAALDLVRAGGGADLPAPWHALLLIEVDGEPEYVQMAAQRVAMAATKGEIVDLAVAGSAAEAAELWQIRKALSPTLRQAAPNKINEDVVVPVSALPALIHGLEELSHRHQIHIVNFGHAGNGNIHVNLLYDAADPTARDAARRCLDEVFSLVLRLRGTLSGEHGVGLEKRDYLHRELEPAALDLMRSLKQLFDPDGILNPGKVLPTT